MGEVHRLVVVHGRDAAKDLVPEDDRRLIDIAAEVLAEASTAFGITYSGFCMTSLPHKKLADNEYWERKGPRISLLIEPGMLYEGDTPKLYGVPYGSRARLIMLYLQTQAIRSDSPEVELGRSMRNWMERMGVPTGGKNYKDVREQANRISACRLTFSWPDPAGRGRGFTRENIVTDGIQLWDLDDSQPKLWVDTVRLSPSFFRALKEHPVPIWEPAIKHISNQSMAIDVYIWLAYRLHSLGKPTPISWAAVHGQFGGGYRNIFHFKPRFVESLKTALAVYPEAHVNLDRDGLILHPSPPPVPEREIARLR